MAFVMPVERQSQGKVLWSISHIESAARQATKVKSTKDLNAALPAEAGSRPFSKSLTLGRPSAYPFAIRPFNGLSAAFPPCLPKNLPYQQKHSPDFCNYFNRNLPQSVCVCVCLMAASKSHNQPHSQVTSPAASPSPSPETHTLRSFSGLNGNYR